MNSVEQEHLEPYRTGVTPSLTRSSEIRDNQGTGSSVLPCLSCSKPQAYCTALPARERCSSAHTLADKVIRLDKIRLAQ